MLEKEKDTSNMRERTEIGSAEELCFSNNFIHHKNNPYLSNIGVLAIKPAKGLHCALRLAMNKEGFVELKASSNGDIF